MNDLERIFGRFDDLNDFAGFGTSIALHRGIRKDSHAAAACPSSRAGKIGHGSPAEKSRVRTVRQKAERR